MCAINNQKVIKRSRSEWRVEWSIDQRRSQIIEIRQSSTVSENVGERKSEGLPLQRAHYKQTSPTTYPPRADPTLPSVIADVSRPFHMIGPRIWAPSSPAWAVSFLLPKKGLFHVGSELWFPTVRSFWDCDHRNGPHSVSMFLFRSNVLFLFYNKVISCTRQTIKYHNEVKFTPILFFKNKMINKNIRKKIKRLTKNNWIT